FEFVVHHVGDVVRRVETNEVQQRERPHGVAAAQLNGIVDVGSRAHTLFIGADGIEQVRHQQPVYDEPGLVASADWNFAQFFGELVSGVIDLVSRGDGAHYFDQFHQRHGIEKVQADETLRAFGGGQKLGNRNGRSIGSKDSVFLYHTVERGVYPL